MFTNMKCGFQKTDGARQCDLCCNDFTPHHFLCSSTSVQHTLVINWASMCIILYCCVHYVKIHTEQRVFADSINFLFSFEENCCWIALIISISLWQPWSIARYVWTMVLGNCFGRKTLCFVELERHGLLRAVKIWGDSWY